MPTDVSFHQLATRPTLNKTRGIAGEKRLEKLPRQTLSGTATLILHYTIVPIRHVLCLQIKLIHIFL